MRMRKALRTIAVALALMLSAADARAIEVAPSARGWEPGSGRLRMQITPCVIAKFSKRAPPCEPPAVYEGQIAEERAAAHLKRAQFFIEIQSYPDARRELDTVLALQSETAETRHLSARLALTTGDIDRAGTDIAAAMRLAPEDVNIRATYAELLYSRSAPHEALREFSAVIEKSPTHAFARLRRAQLMLRFDRPLDALRDLDLLPSGAQPANEHLELRAIANIRLGQPQRAVADYTAALQAVPRAPHLLAGRAKAYERAGDDTAALRDLDTVLGRVRGGDTARALDGQQLAKLLVQRATILVRSKRFDEAADDITAALAAGGIPMMLRMQIFLRQNGFPDVPLDGRDSGALREAIKSCFSRNACFEGIARSI
jgi:tetratricopeptide (TPR) repeat protein